MQPDKGGVAAMGEESPEILEVGEGPSVRVSSDEEYARSRQAAIQQEAAYGIKVWIPRSYTQVLPAVRQSLVDKGLDVLAEMHVRDYLDELADAEFPQYTILCVCSRGLLNRLLLQDREVGLLMPLNLVVYEQSEGTVVEAVDAVALFSLGGDHALQAIAREIKQALEDAVDHVATGFAL